MEIIGKYDVEPLYNGQPEKVIIAKYPNGKYYNHYNYDEKRMMGTGIAGGYDTQEEVERYLFKHRPTARKI